MMNLMWMIVALAIIVILIAAVGVAFGPFLTLKPLPEGAEINGMMLWTKAPRSRTARLTASRTS